MINVHHDMFKSYIKSFINQYINDRWSATRANGVDDNNNRLAFIWVFRFTPSQKLNQVMPISLGNICRSLTRPGIQGMSHWRAGELSCRCHYWRCEWTRRTGQIKHSLCWGRPWRGIGFFYGTDQNFSTQKSTFYKSKDKSLNVKG